MSATVRHVLFGACHAAGLKFNNKFEDHKCPEHMEVTNRVVYKCLCACHRTVLTASELSGNNLPKGSIVYEEEQVSTAVEKA